MTKVWKIQDWQKVINFTVYKTIVGLDGREQTLLIINI